MTERLKTLHRGLAFELLPIRDRSLNCFLSTDSVWNPVSLFQLAGNYDLDAVGWVKNRYALSIGAIQNEKINASHPDPRG